ncbi:NUDIX domain-containing protein [Glycomyces xiaoerkulensis]|uniref:NUDIX domain-containing protein n=1 Tax=Glycomyces xiaoerkulensis TaxID=2038139 RepID=UPI000C25CE39|nr:NUDIX domain-containing protein [Glycomyces xiaoerkulensis]
MRAIDEAPRIDRRGARGIVIDERDHVLFIGRAAVPERPASWIIPGGGIDPGEALAEAAARELFEETGLVVPAEELIGPVARQLFRGWKDEAPFVQENHFFFTRAARFEPRICGGEAYEQDLEFRWIHVDRIASTDGLRRAEPLLRLVKLLTAGDVPVEPLRLEPAGRPFA